MKAAGVALTILLLSMAFMPTTAFAQSEDPLGLCSSEVSLDDVRAVLENPEATLGDVREVLKDSEAKLENVKAVLDNPKASVEDVRAVLENSEDSLEDARAVLDGVKAELKDPKTTLEDVKALLEDSEVSLEDVRELLKDPKTSLADVRELLKDPEVSLKEIRDLMEDPETSFEDVVALMEDYKGPIPFCNSETRGSLVMMLLISVLAGVNYTALGWIKKFRRKAAGEDVPIHWGKFGRAVALGTSLGLVFFVAMGFGAIPVPAFDEKFDLVVWFAAATGGIVMVDRWLLKGSPGSGARAEREAT